MRILDSKIYQIFSTIADLIIVNLLFIVFSVPVITIGASASSLYFVIHKIHKDEVTGVIKLFWKQFKNNLKRGIALFALLLIPTISAGVLVWLIEISDGKNIAPLLTVGIILLYVLLAVTGYIWVLQGLFDNPVMTTFGNAILFAAFHPLRTLLMVLIRLLPVAVAVLFPEFFLRTLVFWLLIGFAAFGYANYLCAYSVCSKFSNENGSAQSPS